MGLCKVEVEAEDETRCDNLRSLQRQSSRINLHTRMPRRLDQNRMLGGSVRVHHDVGEMRMKLSAPDGDYDQTWTVNKS
jgi:hypothetical protein